MKKSYELTFLNVAIGHSITPVQVIFNGWSLYNTYHDSAVIHGVFACRSLDLYCISECLAGLHENLWNFRALLVVVGYIDFVQEAITIIVTVNLLFYNGIAYSLRNPLRRFIVH